MNKGGIRMDYWMPPKRPDELYHWGFGSKEKHKYVAKIGEGKDARYFYSQAELMAYKLAQAGGQAMKKAGRAVEDTVTTTRRGAEDLSRTASRKAEDVAIGAKRKVEDVALGTARKIEDYKDEKEGRNTFSNNVKKKLTRTGEDLGLQTSRAKEDVKRAGSRAAEDVSRGAQRTKEDASRKLSRGVDDTLESTSRNVGEMRKEVRKAGESVTKKLNDTADLVRNLSNIGKSNSKKSDTKQAVSKQKKEYEEKSLAGTVEKTSRDIKKSASDFISKRLKKKKKK